MSEIENKTPEVPAYLQCEPRTYEVKLKDDHDETYDLEFTIVIKCTDEALHEHNNFWSGSKDRLADNNGDIAAVVLKLIGPMVLSACHRGKNWIGIGTKYGINSIFNEEGWSPDSFEITKLYFYDYVDVDSFEIKSIKVEG